MPTPIDITRAFELKPFYKETPKRIGLWGSLIISNLFWIALFIIFGSFFAGLAKFSGSMAKNYVRGQLEISRIKKLTAKELADRDTKIARLIAYQSASPTDILLLAQRVSKILDSASDSKRAFFEHALPEAMLVQIVYGIPASASMAMAIYESNYGRSVLSSKYNNYFGIKAFDDWKGARARGLPTRDLGVLTTADFRAYRSMRDSFFGYADFLKDSKRYKKAFRAKNGISFVSSVLKAGYCPDKTYLPDIRKIMSRHNLAELDKILETTTTKPVQVASFRQ